MIFVAMTSPNASGSAFQKGSGSVRKFGFTVR